VPGRRQRAKRGVAPRLRRISGASVGQHSRTRVTGISRAAAWWCALVLSRQAPTAAPRRCTPEARQGPRASGTTEGWRTAVALPERARAEARILPGGSRGGLRDMGARCGSEVWGPSATWMRSLWLRPVWRACRTRPGARKLAREAASPGGIALCVGGRPRGC